MNLFVSSIFLTFILHNLIMCYFAKTIDEVMYIRGIQRYKKIEYTVLTLCLYRILTQNNMKPVGRNYFKPDDRVQIPQHG